MRAGKLALLLAGLVVGVGGVADGRLGWGRCGPLHPRAHV
jgi:hypothetical protein